MATINAFFTRLLDRQRQQATRLCVGLDPDATRFPAGLADQQADVLTFCRAIIDATHELVCCFKPQIAHFAALGAEPVLEEVIAYAQSLGVPVLLDAKRGDVGSTAERYASELFDRYGADAVTINPYLGLDSMEPYLERADRGVFILCRTSNPGGADLQHLMLDNGQRLFEHVAHTAANVWNENGNVGLVVGATRPEELRRVRDLTGDMTFLLPGIGAQGGSVAESVGAGQGGGLVISSSRAVLYASDGDDYADAARTVARATRDEINRYSN